MQLSGEIPPRSIEKLDEDLSVAFQKMEKITRIMKVLPQIDCGACGTPSCQALAQDVVQGKAKLNQCIFMQKNPHPGRVAYPGRIDGIIGQSLGSEI